MMLLRECLIRTKIKETNLLDKTHNHKASPNQEKINNQANILKAETLLGIDRLVNILEKDDPVVEVALVVTDVGLTVNIEVIIEKIAEILILILSLKSTLLELFEILVKRILKRISLSSERSRISL
jgi:hypothetical protein